MIEYLLLDLDDTILDFRKAERLALSQTLRDFGIDPTDEVLHLYHEINRWHWEQLEKGVFTRTQVRHGRFAQLFRQLGRDADPVQIDLQYEDNLSRGAYFLPGARETLELLKEHYRLFLVSNGTAKVQQGRLTLANLYPLFEQIFVSEEIGFDKPNIAYFDACSARIPGFDREKALLVGDSLTSDIQGGINAGIRTVWVNPSGRDCGTVRPDYRIQSLAELPKLLDFID